MSMFHKEFLGNQWHVSSSLRQEQVPSLNETAKRTEENTYSQGNKLQIKSA